MNLIDTFSILWDVLTCSIYIFFIIVNVAVMLVMRCEEFRVRERMGGRIDRQIEIKIEDRQREEQMVGRKGETGEERERRDN